MFGSNVAGLESIGSFADAHHAYQHLPNWTPRSRNYEPNQRKLKTVGNSENYRIRKNPDGSYAMRMYYTDVVTYHAPDDNGLSRVDIVPWASTATDRFFREIGPDGITASFASAVPHVDVRVRLEDIDHLCKAMPLAGAKRDAGHRDGFQYVALLLAGDISLWLQPDGCVSVDHLVDANVRTKRVVRLNPKATRKLYAMLNMSDYEAWLDMAQTMDPEMCDKMRAGRPNLNLMVEALLARDYHGAVRHHPRVAGSYWRGPKYPLMRKGGVRRKLVDHVDNYGLPHLTAAQEADQIGALTRTEEICGMLVSGSVWNVNGTLNGMSWE